MIDDNGILSVGELDFSFVLNVNKQFCVNTVHLFLHDRKYLPECNKCRARYFDREKCI